MKTLASDRLLRLLALGVCLATLSAWCAPRLAAQTYDARNDFSLAANPNGVWSYGTLSAVTGGAFSLLTVPLADHDYAGQLLWYNGGTYPESFAVQANTSAQSVTFSNTVLIPPDQLNLDGESAIAAVRWTAPADAVYDVSGLFQRNDNQTNAGPVAVTVSIVQNGVRALYQQTNFLTFQSQLPFQLSALPLAAGTTLDFVESSTVPHNDSVGLVATITTGGALSGPIIDVSASVPKTAAGSGVPGVFALTRSGDVSQKLVVRYVVKGSARAGVDYEALSGKVKFKPGKANASVSVFSLDGSDSTGTHVVKLVLQPGNGFTVGDLANAKVKIVGGQ